MSTQKKVEVYTMQYCPYCARAKQLLTQKGIAFKESLVPEDDDAQWDELFKKSGMRTMPQIYCDGKLIGGYNELAALDQKDGLQSLK
jgi:glutaredoxin 3